MVESKNIEDKGNIDDKKEVRSAIIHTLEVMDEKLMQSNEKIKKLQKTGE